MRLRMSPFPIPMKTCVEAQLKDGQFSNTSDYVRHLFGAIRRGYRRSRLCSRRLAKA